MLTTSLNGMTEDQHDLLLAVFSDCREFYASRKQFDLDHKILSNTSLEELYLGWKQFNTALATGIHLPSIPVLAHWPVSHALTSREIRAIRQVLGLYSRLQGHCDSTPALVSYRARVSASRGSVPGHLREIARNLIHSWLGPVPRLLDLHPAHGPGAVAEGYNQIEKLNPSFTFRQLHPFGGDDLLYLNDNHKNMEPRLLAVLKHPITRVVCVPKDFSKPRIISAEPCVMQFLQQGVARYIMARLEMTCPYLNFRDQSVNALLSRAWDQVATLDMSDASDTVSRRHIRQLFPKDWADMLFALRSHFAKLPDGTIVPLRAFAPMGSALCFPIESIVFAAVTVAGYFSFASRDTADARSRAYIRVYGDDIIVPLESGPYIMEILRSCGFFPNRAKCCFQGGFRESCGAEWYLGDDVTVVRPRSLNPQYIHQDIRTSRDAMPMALHATALYQRGFINGAKFLASRCDFPVALGNGAGYVPSILPWPKPGRIRWNSKLQRCEQECLVPVQGTRPSPIESRWTSLFLGLSCGWQSELVLSPRLSAKRKWVLAAPLADR